MPNEQDVVKSVIRKLTAHKAICTRIETSTINGVPDLHVAWCKRSLWIEFKYLRTLPKREATPVKVGLRPEQVNWLENHAHEGLHVCVLARVVNDYLLFTEGFRTLFNGITAAELYDSAALVWRGRASFNAEQCLSYLRLTGD